MHRDTILEILHKRVPDLLGIYAFGSRVHGTARPDSDLDLAVLVKRSNAIASGPSTG